MAHGKMAHVSQADVVANTSARSPRPAQLRTGQPTAGLFLKSAHYHRSRPSVIQPAAGAHFRSCCGPLQQEKAVRGQSLCLRAAANDVAAIQHAAANGNGRHSSSRELDAGTSSVHAGERSGRPSYADSLTTPIVQTSTYHFRNTAELIEYQEGRLGSFEYGRYGNPTAKACEEKIRALEGAEDCLVSASGMNAVTTMLLALCEPGGTIVTTSDCYWRTRQFMSNFLPKMGITVKVIPPNDLVGLQAALDAGTVSLFFSESPTNPYLRCVDVEKISAACHKAGAVVCIDSTFATPINQKALALGADLVLHSATKYLAGHNDVLVGALAGSSELVGKVRTLHHILGGVVDPHAAYLLLRGLKTLDLRVQRHNKSAMEIARRLEEHPKVTKVYYPGLPSHQDHEIARQQMSGYGGVVSFEVGDSLETCIRFIDAVRLPYIAPSLGGVESLIEMPAVQSYWGFGPAKRKEIGINENLIRFSIGVEGVEDIWDDLVQALEQV